jgi:hypothetical protein
VGAREIELMDVIDETRFTGGRTEESVRKDNRLDVCCFENWILKQKQRQR